MGRGDPLLPTSLESLRMAANGLTDKEAAARLGIRPQTVSSRMKAAFVALGANNRTQAVALALAKGLITAEDIVDPLGPKCAHCDDFIQPRMSGPEHLWVGPSPRPGQSWRDTPRYHLGKRECRAAAGVEPPETDSERAIRERKMRRLI